MIIPQTHSDRSDVQSNIRSRGPKAVSVKEDTSNGKAPLLKRQMEHPFTKTKSGEHEQKIPPVRDRSSLTGLVLQRSEWNVGGERGGRIVVELADKVFKVLGKQGEVSS